MWHYRLGDQQYGPVSEDEIKDLIARKVIYYTTPVWAEGMEKWLPAGQTSILSFFAPQQPLVAPIMGVPSYSGAGVASKYPVQFLIAPPNNTNIQAVPAKAGRLPVIITNSKAFNNNIQINMSLDYLNRLVSSLKESNLFLDAGTGMVNFGGNEHAYHQITVSAIETIDPHQSAVTTKYILLALAGLIFFPLFLLFFFLKNDVDMRQKIEVELLSASGVRSCFSAETWGRVKVTAFSNGQEAGTTLSGIVSTGNINSIINQMIAQQDTLGI